MKNKLKKTHFRKKYIPFCNIFFRMRRALSTRKKYSGVTAGIVICIQTSMAAAAVPDSETLPFDFSATAVDFLTTNTNSGLKKNQWGNTSQLILGTDGDLSRLIQWPGGVLHIRESLFGLRHNGSYNSDQSDDHYWVQDMGSTLGGTPLPNFVPRTFLTDLTIEQHLGSHVSVQIGRMNPLNYFDTPSNCETIYSWQNPIFIYDDMTLPSVYATWGGVARYVISKNDTVQVGAYEDNSSTMLTEGFNWATSSASGAFLVSEYVHQEGFDETRYPVTVRIGFMHDTSLFKDPETGREQRGSSAIYWRTANTVWRTNEIAATPSQYLSFFTTGGLSFSSAQPFRYYTEAGVNAHGFLGLPVQDFVGLKLAYLRIRSNQLQAERNTRILAGGPDYTSSANQFRMEMNMHYALVGSISVEPSIEYVWNPNAQFTEGETTAMVPKNGLVFSLSFFAHFPND